MALMVVGCTPTTDSVRATGRAQVTSESQTWSALFWLPPGLFGDWDETSVRLSASAGLQALNTDLPDDLRSSDADLTFRLGAPFDEEIRFQGSFAEMNLEWPTSDCALGCLLDVPVEIRSNVELPAGVTWSTNWTLSIVFPDAGSDEEDLGSQGWVVDGDGASPNSWTAARPEALDLEAGETVTRLVTLSTRDGASPFDHPIALISLSPTEAQALDAWQPVEVGVDIRWDGPGLSADSKGWLTASSPGVVDVEDSLHAQWQLPELQCSGCSRQFAVSFRSDRQTAFWWIPMLQIVPSGSKLTTSSD
jgi:hypothetical protein